MVKITPPIRPSGQLLPQEPDCTTGNPIPFPPNFSLPFLRLAPEIRRKIYRLLFKTTIPVYPTIASNSSVAHEVIQRTSFPTNFLRVSAQLATEASQVLWGENQIVFQFPLEWNERSKFQRWYARSSNFIPQPEHLKRIRDLVIEVYLFRDFRTNTPANVLPRPATIVRRDLQRLCDGLGNEHQLQKVEIRFTNIKTAYNPNEILTTWPPLQHYSEQPNIWGSCCFNSGRGVGFGRKGLNNDEIEVLCRQSIDTDQQVLKPLVSLRGVPEVAVVGRVSPEWTAYLKVCMTAEPGAVFEAFV
jgi:hypothetical protein